MIIIINATINTVNRKINILVDFFNLFLIKLTEQ